MSVTALHDDEQAVSQNRSWSRIDLTAVLDGSIEPARPTMMPRTDGACLVYPGLVHSVHGESESGKSWIVQHESSRQLRAGGRVLYIDAESDPVAVVSRLRLLGCTPEQITQGFDYRRPETRPDMDLEGWEDMMSRRYDFAVIDGVTDAMSLFGRGSNDNDDIATWMRLFPRQLARATGAAVVLVDHVTKSTDGRGRFAIGGQAKMASLDGAAYSVDVVDPMGVGLKGRLRLRVAKDRPGQVRGLGSKASADRTQHVADFVLDSTGDTLSATLWPPSVGPDPAEQKLAHRAVVAVRVINRHPGMSSTQVAEAMRAEPDCDGIRKADLPTVVEYATRQGFVRTEQTGQTIRHYATGSDRFPPVPGTGSPVPDRKGGNREPAATGSRTRELVVDVRSAWADLFWDRWPDKRCRGASGRVESEEALLEALNAGWTLDALRDRLEADLPTLDTRTLGPDGWLDSLTGDHGRREALGA